MKIYTKQGDTGYTSVIGGKRRKGDLRLAAYGRVDEALAWMGVVLTQDNLPKKTKEELMVIMNKLFDLNCVLASIEPTDLSVEDDVTFLEERIDYMDSKLEPLTNFVMPVGDQVFTSLNYLRTLVRKAERNTSRLAQTEMVGLGVLKYLNRLSDYCFMAARYANYCNHQKETVKQL